jgi:hypothetical protein
VLEALAKDNCLDEVTVTVDGTYPIGVSPVLFTASNDAGQSAECTTMLTVRDVTDPLVDCGTPVGNMPSVIRAVGHDACGATVTIENLVCRRVIDGAETPLELADCPATAEGDTIEIEAWLGEGTLEIGYDVVAVDPSGNDATRACEASFEPDRDRDGVTDAADNCVVTQNGNQTDGDGDGVGDACDVCPETSDPGQADADGDGIGDACSDRDRDGVLDVDDNCVDDPNTDQANADGDELGDVCDPNAYQGLTAEGDGSCSGGAGGLLGALAGLLGLAAMAFRRRR